MNEQDINIELVKRLLTVIEQFESMINSIKIKSTFRYKYSLLDNDDVCRLLRISKSQLTNLRKKGKISFMILERKIYYRSEDIHEFIERGK